MKIICVGRNYVKHIIELNNDLPQEPAIFLKPETSLLTGNSFKLPDFSNEIHHEIEIVYRISKSIRNQHVINAKEYINAITIGIDFTARDIQDKLKEKRLSWELSKAFDHSALIGEFVALEDSLNLNELLFSLEINNQIVQKGNTANMIFPIEKILSFVSQYMTIEVGDLIFTGTPEGVGRVKAGDIMKGFLYGEKLLEVEVV